MTNLKYYYAYLPGWIKVLWFAAEPVLIALGYAAVICMRDFKIGVLLLISMLLYLAETLLDHWAFPVFFTNEKPVEYIKSSADGKAFIKSILTVDVCRRIIYIGLIGGMLIFSALGNVFIMMAVALFFAVAEFSAVIIGRFVQILYIKILSDYFSLLIIAIIAALILSLSELFGFIAALILFCIVLIVMLFLISKTAGRCFAD